MPRGLAFPVGVSPRGGARLVEGQDNDNKIIAIALGDDTNDNAFQQNIGLGPAPIFDINDPSARPKITVRLRAIFDRFKAQRRYQLIEDSVKWYDADSGAGEGNLILEFRYLSLEANEERLFKAPVLSAGSRGGGT